MEDYTLKLPFPFYLYLANIKKLKKDTKNPVARNMISVWHQVRKYLSHYLVQSEVMIFSLQEEERGDLKSGWNRVYKK